MNQFVIASDTVHVTSVDVDEVYVVIVQILFRHVTLSYLNAVCGRHFRMFEIETNVQSGTGDSTFRLDRRQLLMIL